MYLQLQSDDRGIEDIAMLRVLIFQPFHFLFTSNTVLVAAARELGRFSFLCCLTLTWVGLGGRHCRTANRHCCQSFYRIECGK